MTQREPHQPLLSSKEMVGINLRIARLQMKLTQHEVGIEVGATGPDVGRWERAVVEPGPAYRQALADLFFGGEIAALYQRPELKEIA